MGYPDIKLVTGPSPDADVLYDFHAAADEHTARRLVLREGFNLGTPSRQGDPDAFAPLYDGRTITWQQRFIGRKSTALAGMADAARRLLRGPGWLRVQLAASVEPVWFRTQWPEPGDLSFEHVSAQDQDDYWTFPIKLPVEPYALSELVTLDPVIVAGDPTAATNPCRWVLPDIEGDVPAPLRFDVRPSTAFTSQHRMWVNVHAGDTQRTPVSVPIGTGDANTAGSDTNAGTSSASASGGSYRNVSFATIGNNFADRLTIPVTVPPGRYKAMLRCATTTTAAVEGIRVQLAQNFGDGDTVFVASDPADGWQWVDLGQINLPRRRPRNPADQGPDFTTTLTLFAGRTSGTAQLRLDHLLLVPVDVVDTLDSRTMLLDYTPAKVLATHTTTWDGDTEDAWTKTTATGALVPGLEPGCPGVFPVAVPGAVNVATLLGAVGPPYAADSVTRDLEVTVSYHPRRLWLGDL